MFEYISKILYVLPARNRSLFFLFLLFLSVSGLEFSGIGLVGPFLSLANNPDLIYKYRWSSQAYNYLGLSSENHFIALIGVLVIIIFIIKSVISWRVKTFVFQFGFSQGGILCKQLMAKYLAAPYLFHLSKSSANIIQSLTVDSRNFSSTILLPMLDLLANLVIILALTILLCITNLVAVVVILGILLPLILVLKGFRNKISQWGTLISRSNQNSIKIINHGLGGIKETTVFGCSSYFENQLNEQIETYVRAITAFFSFKLFPRILIEALLVLFLIGFTSVFLILNKNIQELIPVLGIFTLASIRLMPAMSNMTSQISTLRGSNYTLNRLYSDLKILEKVKTIPNHSKNSITYQDNENYISKYSSHYQKNNSINRIDLNVVTYCYPNSLEKALDCISLTIKKGQSIALIGKSGAGKTTLVDIILGLLVPDSGDIKVNGYSIYNNLRSWQDLIGYIPQSIFLIEDTIKRNIAFGVSDDLVDRQKLAQAIQAAQLEELVSKLPNGIDTEVGERGVRLSGGQRQRIGIARALYHEREILVLDEATSALDNETESLVNEAIKSLSGTKTMIIIAHRLSTVEHCDRIYLMEKGRVVKSGSYQEVVLGESLSPQ